MNDDMIIDLYWRRSEAAIRETAQKYGGYCTAIAMNILQSREDSDECVNDAYLRVWDTIPPQRPVLFRPFLGRVTRNVSLNRYKERHAQKRGGNEIELLLEELEGCVPSGSDVEDEYESGVTAKAIDRFLCSIDAENRIVFVRRYWYADSIAGISERFRVSESKVKSMLFRTRVKLKAYLESEGIAI